MPPPTPKVGRIVHVHSQAFKGQPRPGTITFVHPNGSVSLNVQRAAGVDETPKMMYLDQCLIADREPTDVDLAGQLYWVNWPPIEGARPPVQDDTAIGNYLADIARRLDALESTRRPDCAGRIGPAGIEATPVSAMAARIARTTLEHPDADPPIAVLNVGYIAAQVHAMWLSEWPRTYSPYNKQWELLSDQARRGISRQARCAADILVKSLADAGVPVRIQIDDVYADMPSGQIPELDEAPTRPFKFEEIVAAVNTAGESVRIDEAVISRVLEAVVNVEGIRYHFPARRADPTSGTTGG